MVSDELAPKADGPRADGSGLLLTLDRGIQVLEQIARGQGRATAKSLTADLGINLGTCYQLLRTLQAHGYVHRLHGGRYGLGNRIGFLADHYSSALAPAPELIETLHDLHDVVEETVYLTVSHNGDLAIAGVLDGTRMLRVGNLAAGQSAEPHTSPAAKAFLAYADEAHRRRPHRSAHVQNLARHTPSRRRPPRRTRRDARERGYGVDREEHSDGVAGLAAAILDEDGRPYGAFASRRAAPRLRRGGDLVPAPPRRREGVAVHGLHRRVSATPLRGARRRCGRTAGLGSQMQDR